MSDCTGEVFHSTCGLVGFIIPEVFLNKQDVASGVVRIQSDYLFVVPFELLVVCSVVGPCLLLPQVNGFRVYCHSLFDDFKTLFGIFHEVMGIGEGDVSLDVFVIYFQKAFAVFNSKVGLSVFPVVSYNPFKAPLVLRVLFKYSSEDMHGSVVLTVF